MITKDAITIVNRKGLHARASSALAKLASQFQSEITVKNDRATASAVSILDLMMLGAAKGETISLSATGEDEKAALEALTAFIESGFGEPD